MTEVVAGPVDLTNCDREPIHIPGSVQPHGALLAFGPDDDLLVMSANAPQILGLDVAHGLTIAQLFGDDVAALLRRDDVAEIQPLPVGLGSRSFDVAVHSADGHLVVELEPPVTGAADTSFEALRGIILRLSAAGSVRELCDFAATEIRALTGFDRVMVYRFDPHWNGEVVAEDRRDDLNPFLGLHYPATDIPQQARALYEANWIRVIADVGYEPSPLRPALSPMTGTPLDLSHAQLRSVSPIHIEYLTNMGVAASMSVSLIEHGRLWGLVACHHYAGPHRPSPRVRAAAEFLGQVISLLLAAKGRADSYERTIRTQRILTVLGQRLAEDDLPIAERLAAHHGELLALVESSGAALHVDGGWSTFGATPAPEHLDAVAAWAGQQGGEVISTDALGREVPALADLAPLASGVLAAPFGADGDVVLWFRPEVIQTVNWGGDPQNKVIAVTEDDTVRLSPRKSFDLWKETVRLTSLPWFPADHTAAEDVARQLSGAVLRQTQEAADVARTLQQALAPTFVPQTGHLAIAATYSSSGLGEVGGDWYDVLSLPDDGVAVVVGDVAGHGLPAAVTMARLRHAAQAYLLEDHDPGTALERLNRLARWALPGEIASAIIAVFPAGGAQARIASAGHVPPVHLRDGRAALLDLARGPVLGAVAGARYPATPVPFDPASMLLLYTDGLVERRGEPIDVGLERLRATAEAHGATDTLCSAVVETMEVSGQDDVAVVAVRYAEGA